MCNLAKTPVNRKVPGIATNILRNIILIHGNLHYLRLISNSSLAKTWLSTRKRISGAIKFSTSTSMVECSWRRTKEPRFGRQNLKSRQMRWYTHIHTCIFTSKIAQKRMVSGLGNPAWSRTRPGLVCCEAWWLRRDYMALCLRDWKQVQKKWFDSHLTGVKKGKCKLAHGNNSTLQERMS